VLFGGGVCFNFFNCWGSTWMCWGQLLSRRIRLESSSGSASRVLSSVCAQHRANQHCCAFSHLLLFCRRQVEAAATAVEGAAEAALRQSRLQNALQQVGNFHSHWFRQLFFPPHPQTSLLWYILGFTFLLKYNFWNFHQPPARQISFFRVIELFMSGFLRSPSEYEYNYLNFLPLRNPTWANYYFSENACAARV